MNAAFAGAAVKKKAHKVIIDPGSVRIAFPPFMLASVLTVDFLALYNAQSRIQCFGGRVFPTPFRVKIFTPLRLYPATPGRMMRDEAVNTKNVTSCSQC
jgi:hypothetical protein